VPPSFDHAPAGSTDAVAVSFLDERPRYLTPGSWTRARHRAPVHECIGPR